MRTEGDHDQVSENVFNNLPAWEQEVWRDLRERFIGTYSWYPDVFVPLNDPEAMAKTEPCYKELACIDDRWVCELLNCEERPFWPFGRWYGQRTTDRLIEWGPFNKVFGYYFDMMVSHFRRGDPDTAAKVGGFVSHLLCDHHPCDHIDAQTWQGLLVPPPPDAKCVTDCWPIITQQVDIPRVRYESLLLGTTPAEVMFRFYQRYLAMVKSAVGQIHRMLLEAYAGRQDQAQQILSQSRLLGIEITSDFIHTAFCVAYGRFEPAQLAALGALDLTQVFPVINEMDYTYTFGPYTDAVIEFFDGTRLRPHKLPPDLLVRRAGQAQAVLENVKPVLSVLADSGVQFADRRARLAYALPEGAYRRFRALAGMAPGASHKPEKGLRGNVAVKVLGDGKVLFEIPSIFGDDPAVEIDVPIAGVKILELWVTNLYKTPEQFWLGQFVWGRPTLVR
jgi:AcrR family transcriptional regulator